MVKWIIMLCLIAVSTQANWFEVWAQGMPSGVVAAYAPPGLSTHSGFWWRFTDNARTNIPDYGPSGTNKCWLVDASSTATWSNGGWRLNASSVNYIRSSDASLIGGATCFTYAVWVKLDSLTPAGWLIGETTDSNQTGIQPNTSGIIHYNRQGTDLAWTNTPMTTGVWYRVVLVEYAAGYGPSGGGYAKDVYGYINGIQQFYHFDAYNSFVFSAIGKTTLGRVYWDAASQKGTFAQAVLVKNYAWTTNDVAYDYQNCPHP